MGSQGFHDDNNHFAYKISGLKIINRFYNAEHIFITFIT